MNLFEAVPPNGVQCMGAFRATDLQGEAVRLGHQFLHANCADATTELQVLDRIAKSFHFPDYFGRNFDALMDCLTDLDYDWGPQSGFLVVIEQLPNTPEFDKGKREILLDVLRNAADFWAEEKVAFRVFYSFR